MDPYGCAICGVAARGHAYRGSPGHRWIAPTDAMIKDRMQRRHRGEDTNRQEQR